MPTMLERIRRSPKWLIVLIGVVALTVTSAALVPHDEDADGQRCLVCKAASQPLTELTIVSSIAPPPIVASSLHVCRVRCLITHHAEAVSSRAPPA